MLFSDPDLETARLQAECVHQKLKALLQPPTEILPVMPAGHAKVKDRYRFQFLIKTFKISQIKEHLKNLPGAKIDVDPTATYF